MFNRENITLVVIFVCVVATVYLFKEINSMKSQLDKPPQIIKMPYPVHVNKNSKKINVQETNEETDDDELEHEAEETSE